MTALAAQNFEKAYTGIPILEGLKVELAKIPASACARGPYQPRRHFDKEALSELADSIRTLGGNFSPIVVRRKFDSTFEIVAGERRVRAVNSLAEMDLVLAFIGDFTDEQASIIATVENLQREDLNPIEEARGYEKMASELNMTHAEIGLAVSKGRTHITNSIRLLSLDFSVREYVEQGKLSKGHAKCLAGVESTAKQRDLARKIYRNKWSVRQLEELLRKQGALPTDVPAVFKSETEVELNRLEDALSQKVSHPVRITFDSKKGSGEFRIKYFDSMDFEGVLELVGGKGFVREHSGD